MKRNRIQSENEYRSVCQAMDLILAKGTIMGDMDLLPNEDKTEYIRLSSLVREWEKKHYPHPIPVNPLIAQIQDRMTERNLKQRDTAILLGIDEARMSEILRGKKSIGMRLAKKLRENLQINADIILDYA